MSAEFTLEDNHQGWPGVVNGGIITALLYEVMENPPFFKGLVTMSKSTETKFRRPANTGETITARSWVADRNGRHLAVQADLRNPAREIIAEGSASLVVVDKRMLEKLGIAV